MADDLDGSTRIEIVVVRLEGQIEGLRTEVRALKEATMARVDSAERQAQQTFTLVDERFKTMDHRLASVEAKATDQENKLTALDRWRAQTVGIAIGSALFGGGTAGLIIKAMGA